MRVSAAKAYGASVFLHVGAIGALSAWGFRENDDATRFQGARQVIYAEWSAPATPEAPPPLSFDTTPVAADRVVIMPQRAEVEQRRLVETAAQDVPSAELLQTFETPDAIPVPPPPRELARSAPERAEAPPQIEPVPAKAPERTVRPATRPPTPASAASAPPVATLGTDDSVAASFANNAPPRYPEQARRAGWQGTVLLELTVAPSGDVTNVRVLESSGYDVLDAAAVTAVRQWKGRPARRGGEPVSSTEVLPVRFKL